MSTTLDEDRVRRKAQEIWEAEGRPEGRADSHWMQAREIVELKDSYDSTLTPVEDTLEEEAEPAVAFENQGEFPELTDLGEGVRGPSWQAARETTGADDEDADPDNVVPSQGTRA